MGTLVDLKGNREIGGRLVDGIYDDVLLVALTLQASE